MNSPTSSASVDHRVSAGTDAPRVIPLLPLHGRPFRLECRRATTIGLFPEARLASLLMASMAAHKDGQDSVSIEVPRTGRHRVDAGDIFGFTLFASIHDAARVAAIDTLLGGLPHTAPPGYRSAAFGDNWTLRDGGNDGAFVIDEDALSREAGQWAGVQEFRLRLTSPTRIQARQRGVRGRLRYCREEADIGDEVLGQALVSSLVSLKFALKLGDWLVPTLPLHILRKELFLVDPGRRSEDPAKKPLDEGLLGEFLVEWREPPTADQWRHLVLLQYLGIGQGRAFGLGRMQLELRDGASTKQMPCVEHCSLVLAAEERNVALALEHVRRRQDLAVWPELGEERVDDPPPAEAALIDRLMRRLSSGTVEPAPLFPVSVAKPDGDTRELLIPGFFDRVAQRAVLQVIEPGLDALFCESSFGFRRGRGREAARARIEVLRDSGYTVVGETDVRRFFDDVGWWRIECRLRCLFGSDPLVAQILRWLEAERTDGISRLQGLPQGAPLSPILSNLMLDHLDRVLAQRGVQPVRFADDLIVLCKSEAQARDALEIAATTLADAGLRLKLEKTRVTTFAQGFRFLGYRFVGGLVVESRRNEVEAPVSPPASLREYLAPPVEPDAPQRALAGSGEEPGLLLVVSEKGASLRLAQGQLLLERAGGSQERFPFAMLAGVMLLARAQLSTEVIKAAMRAGVPLNFLSESGQWYGSTRGEPDGATLSLWRLQHERVEDLGFRMGCARALVCARIHSMMTVLAHRRAPPSAVESLKRSLGAAGKAATLDELRGVEGHATSRYFERLDDLLPSGFDFRGRSRCPPRDPVNAMLSFSYTLLHQAAHCVLQCAQLNPRIGVYHQPRGTHAALASDFMEPFRFLVERQVLSQLNRREFKPDDFVLREDGACWLNPGARRRFVIGLHQRLQAPLRAVHADRAFGIYGHLQHQAEQLKAALSGGSVFTAPRFR